MPRPSNPMTMTFPPFAGAVRGLVLANLAVFFAAALLEKLAPASTAVLIPHLLLRPAALLHGELWQPFTYSFFHFGILEVLFALLTLWFCGAMLESAFGSRWLRELYFVSAIGAALLASALSFTHILHLSPQSLGQGAWAPIFGLLIAIAMRFGEQEFLIFFLLRMRAKYMVAVYILIAVALLLKADDAFGALLQLSGALCGFLYLRFAPSRGLGFGVSERYYGLRNAYYRSQRRRAARKFEVYMGKQGRQVQFDKDGRYIDPDDLKKNPPDRRWMN